jgi:hypothetical protein
MKNIIKTYLLLFFINIKSIYSSGINTYDDNPIMKTEDLVAENLRLLENSIELLKDSNNELIEFEISLEEINEEYLNKKINIGKEFLKLLYHVKDLLTYNNEWNVKSLELELFLYNLAKPEISVEIFKDDQKEALEKISFIDTHVKKLRNKNKEIDTNEEKIFKILSKNNFLKKTHHFVYKEYIKQKDINTLIKNQIKQKQLYEIVEYRKKKLIMFYESITEIQEEIKLRIKEESKIKRM